MGGCQSSSKQKKEQQNLKNQENVIQRGVNPQNNIKMQEIQQQENSKKQSQELIKKQQEKQNDQQFQKNNNFQIVEKNDQLINKEYVNNEQEQIKQKQILENKNNQNQFDIENKKEKFDFEKNYNNEHKQDFQENVKYQWQKKESESIKNENNKEFELKNAFNEKIFEKQIQGEGNKFNEQNNRNQFQESEILQQVDLNKQMNLDSQKQIEKVKQSKIDEEFQDSGDFSDIPIEQNELGGNNEKGKGGNQQNDQKIQNVVYQSNFKGSEIKNLADINFPAKNQIQVDKQNEIDFSQNLSLQTYQFEEMGKLNNEPMGGNFQQKNMETNSEIDQYALLLNEVKTPNFNEQEFLIQMEVKQFKLESTKNAKQDFQGGKNSVFETKIDNPAKNKNNQFIQEQEQTIQSQTIQQSLIQQNQQKQNFKENQLQNQNEKQNQNSKENQNNILQENVNLLNNQREEQFANYKPAQFFQKPTYYTQPEEKLNEVEKYYQTSINYYLNFHEPSSPSMITPYTNAGCFYLNSRNLPFKAEEYFIKCIEILQKNQENQTPENKIQIKNTIKYLIQVYKDQRKPEKEQEFQNILNQIQQQQIPFFNNINQQPNHIYQSQYPIQQQQNYQMY